MYIPEGYSGSLGKKPTYNQWGHNIEYNLWVVVA